MSARRGGAVVALLTLVLAAPAWGAASLTPLAGFGSNPGNLDAFTYVPASAAAGAPLVVVLHGCTQTASSMLTTGIIELADEQGLVLLFPQQKSANNPMTCFNWGGEYGDPANLVRGQGENESVRQMVDAVQAKQGTDPGRVFAIGFSAGAGLASILAATWPDKFAGVAIMSGLPYRCAADLNGSYACMQGSVTKTAAQWGDLVRAAHSGYGGPYPRIAVFHGASDGTVNPTNFAELVKQWSDVHGLPATPVSTETIGSVEHAVYGDELVTFKVTGMGHAVAVGTDPVHPCGTAGAFIESRGFCAMYRALAYFGEAAPVPPPADGGATATDGGVHPDPGTDCGTPDAGRPAADGGAGGAAAQSQCPVTLGSGCSAAGAAGAAGGLPLALVALLAMARRRRAATVE